MTIEEIAGAICDAAIQYANGHATDFRQVAERIMSDAAMTDDKAKAILRDCGGDIQMNPDGTPDWRAGLVVVNAVLSSDELRALLHFAQRVNGRPMQRSANASDEAKTDAALQ